MKIFIKITFNGNSYRGYQVQKNQPTIQEELNRAAKKLFGFDCDITGCSRTDSGVHAQMFCATISKANESGINCIIPIENVAIALNSYLPSNIAVYEASYINDEFHARHDVISKEYIYKIWASQIRNPLLDGLVYSYPANINDEAFANMQIAIKYFVGEYEFKSFMAKGSKIINTKRQIYYTDLKRDNNLIEFKICANGFLYNMVRIIVGTILWVAEGKISADAIPAIIASKDRKSAGMTAPPEGLYLSKVNYN